MFFLNEFLFNHCKHLGQHFIMKGTIQIKVDWLIEQIASPFRKKKNLIAYCLKQQPQ